MIRLGFRNKPNFMITFDFSIKPGLEKRLFIPKILKNALFSRTVSFKYLN